MPTRLHLDQWLFASDWHDAMPRRTRAERRAWREVRDRLLDWEAENGFGELYLRALGVGAL